MSVRTVLGTYESVAIGERKIGCYDAFGNWNPSQPYVVLREVTRADHLAWLHACGQYDDKPVQPHARFYEVSTD